MPCPSVLEYLEHLAQLRHVLSVLNVLRNYQIDLIISGHLEHLRHFLRQMNEPLVTSYEEHCIAMVFSQFMIYR